MAKRKTSMTAFDVAAVIQEFQRLKGARLNNIYEVTENTFMFRFKGVGDYRVIAEPARRIHFTNYDVSGKEVPPPFVMGLRKYIRGSKVKEVRQVGFDRIVEIIFDNGYKLIVETLPRGVLALVDPNNVILHVNEQREMRDRVVKRGVEYKTPPSTTIHPLQLNLEVLRQRLEGYKDVEIVRALVRALGYPGEVVEEVLHRVGIDKTVKSSNVDVRMLELIVEEFKRIYNECLEAKGYIVYDEKGLVLTVVPFKPTMFEEFRVVGSFSDAVDEFFVELEKAKMVEEAVKKLEEERGRLEAMIEKTKRLIDEYIEKKRRLEKRAQVIAENSMIIDDALECVRRIRERAGWDMVLGNCPNVVDVEPSRGVVKISVGGEILEFEIHTSSSQEILRIYQRIGELEKKIARAREALKELEKKLENLKEEISIEVRKAKARVRRKEWYEKYHWMFTSNWVLVIGGRDASQNESIVKRYLGDKNIFMHADIRGAPAVILFVQGKQPDERDLREAAVLAACYSKAWKEQAGYVDVYWVWGSQVSKSPPPGEYLTKGAFMVYGKRNYIRGVELKLALGLGVEDDAPIIIVGPVDLVKRRSLVYAVLVPGDEDPSKVAKRLISLFRSRLGDKAYLAKSLEVDDVLRRIPGPSRILEIARGEAREPPRRRGVV